MNWMDDLQARLDARMKELNDRIDAIGAGRVHDGEEASREKPSQPRAVQAGRPAAPAAPAGGGAQGAGSGGAAQFPTDDSSGPSLHPGDVAAVSDYDFRVTGVPPDVESPFPAGTKWRAYADALAQARFTVAHCTVSACKKGGKGLVEVDDCVFPRQSVVARGVPQQPHGLPGELLERVCRAAAYYALRWKYRRLDDIRILWEWVEIVLDESQSTIAEMRPYDNACFSLGSGGPGQTVLQFSTLHSNFETAGHEFTHAVSQDRVGWAAYYGETGALNESFSDIFGKFNRWAWEGRDLYDVERWVYSGMRDMKHPENICQGTWWPATYYKQGPYKGSNSGWYHEPDKKKAQDNNGVHINNGVIARLCALLCEGEKFQRDDGKAFDVQPIGFARTEALFGALLFGKRRYLPKAATMYAFCNGILLAAEDLGFQREDKQKLWTACDAVNIIPPEAAGVQWGATERRLGMGNGSSRASADGMPVPVGRAVAESCAGELGLREAGAGYVVVEDRELEPAGGERGFGGEPEEREVVLEQTWQGLPVFGASAIARVRNGNAVTYLHNGFSRSLGRLGGARDRIGAQGAAEVALGVSAGGVVSSIRQVVWDPAVLALDGDVALAWHVETAAGGLPEKQVIIDAATGEILMEAPLRTN